MSEPGGVPASRFICPCLACGSWRRLGELLERYHAVESYRLQSAGTLRAVFDQLWDKACELGSPLVPAPVAEGVGTFRPEDQSLRNFGLPRGEGEGQEKGREKEGSPRPTQSSPKRKEKKRSERSRSRRRRRGSAKREVEDDSRRVRSDKKEEAESEEKGTSHPASGSAPSRANLAEPNHPPKSEAGPEKKASSAPISPGEKATAKVKEEDLSEEEPPSKRDSKRSREVSQKRSHPRPSHSQVAVPRRREEPDKPPGHWELRLTPRPPSHPPPERSWRGHPQRAGPKSQSSSWQWPKTSRGRVQRERREDIAKYGPDPERKRRREERWGRWCPPSWRDLQHV